MRSARMGHRDGSGKEEVVDREKGESNEFQMKGEAGIKSNEATAEPIGGLNERQNDQIVEELSSELRRPTSNLLGSESHYQNSSGRKFQFFAANFRYPSSQFRFYSSATVLYASRIFAECCLV